MQQLSPRMVEDSYRYWRAAVQLVQGYDLMDVAQVNAALGMEILLKSFLSRPNSDIGELWEIYELGRHVIKAAHDRLKASGEVNDRIDWHDLWLLLHAIPEAIRNEVGLNRHLRQIKADRDVFTSGRYRYKKDSRQVYCTGMIGVLQDVIPRVVDYHMLQGSQDPFILHFQSDVRTVFV